MASERLSLSVVILNFRTPEMTLGCVAALESEVSAARGERVILVDNDSGDGSAEVFERAIAERSWGEWVELVRSPINGGFSSGNNLGIREREAEAYLLLNSDTVVRPGAIAALQRVLRERPQVGLVGPRLVATSGEPQVSCFRAHSPLGELESAARTGPLRRLMSRWVVSDPAALDVSRRPDWISFACVLVRRAVFDRVGLLDSGYFMYFEDSDLCRRATEAGWEIAHCAQAVVEHVGEASDPATRAGDARPRRPSYFYAARARYYRKFYGRPGLAAANVLWTLGRSLAAGRELLGREQGSPPLDRREIWRYW